MNQKIKLVLVCINSFTERIKIDCDQEHSSIDSNSLRAIIDLHDLHVNTVQDILQTSAILGKDLLDKLNRLFKIVYIYFFK